MRMAAAAATAETLAEVVEVISDCALEALGAAALSVRQWQRDRACMRVLVNVGELAPGDGRVPQGQTMPLREHPAVERMLHSGRPYFTAWDDPDAHPGARRLLESLGHESSMGVPVIVAGAVWGEVWAATTQGSPRFRAADLRFLEAVAAQLAGVVLRADRLASVSRLAFEDDLTGMLNRRAVTDHLERAMATWSQDGAPVALLLCDVDGLERLNDGRGHRAGDRALKRVAEALLVASAPFPGAMVGRMAGDEFAVVLEGAALPEAREVAADALRILAEGRDTPVSLSCGAAVSGPGVANSASILRAADSAQYAAKQRGGSQACTAEATAVHESLSGRRRGRRRRIAERLEETATRLLELLDGELEERAALDRLEVVVAGFAEALNAAAWAISFAPHGSETIRSLSTADDRDGRLAGLRVGLDAEVYELSRYPETERLVRAGVGCFRIDRHDRDADEAERALLADLGLSGVLGAAAADHDGVYLLELYADGDTHDLSAAELRLQLLSRAAAGRSASGAERMGQLAKRTRQLAVTSALGARLAAMVGENEIVEAAVDELFQEFGFPLCSVLRLTGDDDLEVVAARGEVAERLRDSGWRQPAGLGLLGRAVREGDIVVVGDVNAEPDYRVTQETSDTRSEMCAPLWAGDRLWGVINLEDPRLHAFDEDDARLVKTVADQVSSALRSAHLYERLEQAYLGTAEALGAALEAKDTYTAKHSRSIADNAVAVGRALGMTEEELRQLRFGAAFHDIGKLAIPEAILNKPGKLDPEERMRIEQHTVIGDQILAPIEFLEDVRPLVRHGHERWDGEGYPDKLVGEQIPLGARIIFTCDAYDAMTSDRPYRPALPSEVAREELAKNAGTQFDPQVVDALLVVLDSATDCAA